MSGLYLVVSAVICSVYGKQYMPIKWANAGLMLGYVACKII
jgi:hypothetical protein